MYCLNNCHWWIAEILINESILHGSLFLNSDKLIIFVSLLAKKVTSTHSSMDRIMDSGSIDWGSTPHGCTSIRVRITLIIQDDFKYSECNSHFFYRIDYGIYF